MDLKSLSVEQLNAAADSALEEAAVWLHNLVSELAARLQPFASFGNMVSIQAIELQPTIQPRVDRGCVVVCPDGEICELNLQVLPGIGDVSEVEPVEEFRALSLTAAEYIVYGAAAVQVLTQELRRRGTP